MKAEFYHISIDFRGPIDEDHLRKKLDLANDWIHYIPNCWIVRTTSDSAKWYTRMRPLLGPDDTMLIVKLDMSDRTARLPDWVMAWMDKHRMIRVLFPKKE